MTISTTYAPSTYAGDGSTTSFPITFAYLSDADNITVSLKDNTTGVITAQVVTTHFTVSGSNVVFVTAPASGNTVLIELNPSYLQESDYRENGSLPAETLEGDLDQLKLEVQLAKSKADSALILDPVAATTLTSNVIVASNTAGANAGKFVRFNETGTGLEIIALSATAGLSDIVNDPTPQLGGDLDLNGSDITGTGNINTTGNITITGTLDATSINGGAQVLGSADEVQLKVKGHSTQTANIFEVRNSANGLALGTDTAGNTYVNGNITVGGTVDGRDIAADGTALDGLIAAGTSGVSSTVTQASHGLAVGNVIRLSGAGTYTKAQADSAANAEVVGIVTEVPNVNTFKVAVAGKVTGLSGLTANTVYFLSAATAGALTATEPSTIGQVSKPVLISDSTTSGYILPHRGAVVSVGASTAASQGDMEAATSTTAYVTPATTQYHPGVAKAWVNFNGTGTVAIRRAYNVTSITDNGTGAYTLNFTTAFSDANYCVIGQSSISLASNGAYFQAPYNTTPSTTACRVQTMTPAGTATDCEWVQAAVFGDQ